MSHFAEIDSDGNILRVIVAEQDFINSGVLGDPQNWIQTSYTNRIRKNYASIGGKYDRVLDAFIPPKPFNSWILNEQTCLWESPIAYPNDGQNYYWDESQTKWILFIKVTEQQII
jgi:hypothetical protein